MKDSDCTAFLRWSLPQLGLRWPGYRKVRRTVCKRIARRTRQLGLADVTCYRAHLVKNEDEWTVLDGLCRIPISRFWRDREVFDCVARDVLPALAATALARDQTRVRVWSAGCASGEEPYSLGIAWSLAAETTSPTVGIDIVATDADETMLARAATGAYRRGSLRDLAPELVDRAFRRHGDQWSVRRQYCRHITFLRQDIRTEMPDGPFDLVLCRNLVFTYFDERIQAALLRAFARRLRPGAGFVIGMREKLPEPHAEFIRWNGPPQVYRFAPAP